MDFKTFLENFDTIAQAPGGIAKLRSLILDLAVRGKLVPQNPEDEPATGIVKRVQEIRKAKKISEKKSGKLEIPDDWELPIGWVWSCLQELGEINPKNDLPDELKVGFVPMALVPTDYRQVVDYEERQWGEIKKGFTHFANGDVGIAKITPCFQNRKSVVFSNLPNNYGAGTTELSIFRSLSESVDPKYVLLFLKTPSFINEGVLRMTGTAGQQRIPREYFAGCAFPLPPLAEQKRIVEKVDELMALCDRLQASQEARDNLRQKLRASAIDSLMNAETDEELKKSWAIVRDNWQTLSQKPEDVDDLRRSVLQLAVRGKLVSQNSNAEPASVLLAEITKEQKQLIEERKVRKPENLPPIQLDDMPFLLPQEWIWVYVQDVGEVKLGRQRSPQNHTGPYMVPYLRVANVLENKLNLSDVKSMNFSPEEQVTFRLKYGDILLNEGQSYELVGRPALYRDEVPGACFQNTLLRFRVYGGLVAEYALIVFRAYLHNGRFRKEAQQTTNIAHLSANRLSKIEFPLPPRHEQKQIVAKVDELMQICDQLEESLRQSQQRVEALAASAISHLTI
ncbi:restriction endonuclease subunit S [Phormidium tenue FACHB-886]|nr:restriction endonuclease subunit S [Phormidium tenue FACHB-886]